MTRLGIIGFGKMGKLRAQASQASGMARITHIFDANSENIIEASEYTVVKSPEEILTNPEVDAVCICLPNKYNAEVTEAALRAGKHVFCEKPPAFNAAEVSRIQEVERVSNKKLMFGFNHRHHEAVVKMKDLIANGSYGRTLWMRGRYGKSVDETYFETWRADKELAGGGILLDQGIHMLDLFLFLGGPFDEVKAMVSNLYWQLEGIEDNVFALLSSSRTGVQASLHSTMTQWRHLFSLEVFLERGYMTLNGLKTSSGTYGEEVLTVAQNRSVAPAATWDDEQRFVYAVDHSWEREMKHFFDCVENDSDIKIGTSADAHSVMVLIDKIYQNERFEADVLRRRLMDGIR